MKNVLVQLYGGKCMTIPEIGKVTFAKDDGTEGICFMYKVVNNPKGFEYIEFYPGYPDLENVDLNVCTCDFNDLCASQFEHVVPITEKDWNNILKKFKQEEEIKKAKQCAENEIENKKGYIIHNAILILLFLGFEVLSIITWLNVFDIVHHNSNDGFSFLFITVELIYVLCKAIGKQRHFINEILNTMVK